MISTFLQHVTSTAACVVLVLVGACTGKAESTASTTTVVPVRGAALPRRAGNTGTRVAAAGVLTSGYAQSPLSGWNVHARAAGPDCGILLVEIGVIMEDSMIEAMHYGIGAYAGVYEGGVQRFYRDRAFHGVAYRDASSRVWTYGSVSQDASVNLTPCR